MPVSIAIKATSLSGSLSNLINSKNIFPIIWLSSPILGFAELKSFNYVFLARSIT